MRVWGLIRPHGWRHAGDEALAVLAMAGPEAAGDVVASHIGGCSRCAGRLAAIEQILSDDQRQLIAESDHALPPARLEEQRAAILRRIGGSRATARILPFPAHGPIAVAPRRPLWKRSVAAAAVAGLIGGAAAGRFYDTRRQPLAQARLAAQQRMMRPEPAVRTLQASMAADEAFLRDFEAALVEPRVETLRAIDALTPLPFDDRGAP